VTTPLRTWLQKHPMPDVVRGSDSNDVDREVKLGVGRTRWRDAEKALDGCWRLEALDAQGRILRTFDAAEAPNGRPSGGNSERMSELAELADIMVAAADKAAARHEAAYHLAFTEMVGLVRILADRLGGLEKAWHKSLMTGAPAPDEGLTADSMVKDLIMNQVASKMFAPPNGKEPDGG
jgi:hypothetical protein